MLEPNPTKPSVPPQQLPEQGGLLWVAGGVPATSLPDPCIRCLQLLSQLTDEDLARFLQRTRDQTGLQPADGTSTPI
jgi:hypothetical protein